MCAGMLYKAWYWLNSDTDICSYADILAGEIDKMTSSKLYDKEK